MDKPQLQKLLGPIVTAFAFTHSSLARHGDDDDGKFVTFISSKVGILYIEKLFKKGFILL